MMDSLTKPGICDLPTEILEIIFDLLTVRDLKNASLVCLRWSHLAFSGHRIDRICFGVHKPYQQKKSISVGQRQYRHIRLACDDTEENIHIEFIKAIQRFKNYVTSFNVSGDVEVSQIQCILLEVPNLKSLSLTRPYHIDEYYGIIQLPVLHQLYDLKIRHYSSLLEESLDICPMAPNLQRISMDCYTENALKVFRHFSHQLQSVKAFIKNIDLTDSFCEIRFPKLLDIEVDFPDWDGFVPSSAFIAGSKHLQRATLKYERAAMFVDIFVDNCLDLTFLHTDSMKLENGCLNGVANLTKLKILKLTGKLDCNIFEECLPISSLQELHLVYRYEFYDVGNASEFLKGLPMVMPNLKRLCARNCVNDDYLLFTCNNMLSLKRLELTGGLISERGVQHFDRLTHLIELKFHNVRISAWDEDGLLPVPATCPSLTMRERNRYEKECIQKLRSLMPSCTVIVTERSH